MTIALAAAFPRHERRIRVLFTSALSPLAFDAALFAVACTNSLGADPPVKAAIPIPGTPIGVDLALGIDLVEGGAYTVTVAPVLGLDGTTSPPAAQSFLFGELVDAAINAEEPAQDLAALVYGVDLVWTGSDFLETSSGDLATVSGLENVQGALLRRLTHEIALPWDPNYGAQAANFVNGPSPASVALLGVLRRQAVADDRVAQATITVLEDPASPGDVYFPTSITLRGDSQGAPLSLAIYPPGTS